jgi:hypothetical protein
VIEKLCSKCGDIQLVCHQCNRTKGERTMKEFVKYCDMISKTHTELS